ncbi:MAG: hypothetical protein IMW88_07355 [Thermoflavifilum sp.]|uniref:LuxR C-terminal-related transcriptional regulator n=1 Tax=Thermoflavifilum sp. TaxID=1968839 RepID=UPI0018A62450|nr:LuxR C-terminal-related transcriptional regulator [Thermoflavifilum sp.]QOR75189.1 MAG: hypothetical protein IMW88_07355 [Thermoflavifilum sp.]
MKIPDSIFFSRYFASTHVMACLLDLTTRNMVWCNDTFKNHIGYIPTEQERTSIYAWRRMVHPDDWPVILHIMKCIGSGHEICAGIFRLTGADAQAHWTCGLFYHLVNSAAAYLFIRLFPSGLIVNTPDQLQKWIDHLNGKDVARERYRLTRTERLILCLLAEGMTHVEIAQQLHRSLHTIRTHVAHIKAKCQLHHSTQLIALAHRMGLHAEIPENKHSSDQHGHAFF